MISPERFFHFVSLSPLPDSLSAFSFYVTVIHEVMKIPPSVTWRGAPFSFFLVAFSFACLAWLAFFLTNGARSLFSPLLALRSRYFGDGRLSLVTSPLFLPHLTPSPGLRCSLSETARVEDSSEV